MSPFLDVDAYFERAHHTREHALDEYQVPHLVDEVRQRLSKFEGDLDMLFGIAVAYRVDHYRRFCGLVYPRATEAAIAVTRHYSRGRFVG